MFAPMAIQGFSWFLLANLMTNQMAQIENKNPTKAEISKK